MGGGWDDKMDAMWKVLWYHRGAQSKETCDPGDYDITRRVTSKGMWYEIKHDIRGLSRSTTSQGIGHHRGWLWCHSGWHHKGVALEGRWHQRRYDITGDEIVSMGIWNHRRYDITGNMTSAKSPSIAKMDAASTCPTFCLSLFFSFRQIFSMLSFMRRMLQCVAITWAVLQQQCVAVVVKCWCRVIENCGTVLC